MRVSHKELKRKINQEQLKITDRELFCSRAFAGFLTDMAEAATKRYKRKIKVHVFYDESENAKTAYTDNESFLSMQAIRLQEVFPQRYCVLIA